MESPLPPGWTAYNTEDGQTYYHNANQNLTQWERPMVQTTSSTPADLVIGQPTFTSLAGGNMTGDGMKAGMVEAQSGPDLGAAAINEIASQALKYYDVTTDAVLKRLRAASLPFRLFEGQADHAMVEELQNKPDFYGPFWICMTASLALFAGSHVYCWASDRLIETYYSEFYVAILTTFAFWLLVPILVRGAALWNSVEPQLFKLAHLACVFGYSFWPIVPMSLLCCVPSKFLQLIFVALALGMSATFMVANMTGELSKVERPLRLAFLTVFIVGQLVYYALVPSYFFHLPTAFISKGITPSSQAEGAMDQTGASQTVAGIAS